MKSKYIDRVTLFLQSGKGGDGSCSFRREIYVPKGGPDGGDGGKGGDVIFRVNKRLFTLNHLRYKHHFRAEDGENGKGQQKHGRDGKDVVIEVPPGTVILDKMGNELNELLEGEIVFLRGGRGGRGNVHFKSSVNQAPRRFEKGKNGESEEVILELRLIADVGLVGLPNAGKSTFLKVVTKANPKIADYPFTTLEPNLGILTDGIKIVRIADIPGIIEGASEGKGLGNRFLKHISRVNILVFVIDITGDIEKTYKILLSELENYDRRLLKKKRIVLFNKTDLLENKNIKVGEIFKDVKYTFASLINNDTGNIEDIILKEIENYV
ncbi:MAG: GTPase ObgE [candidate division WOR-3 bacterium]